MKKTITIQIDEAVYAQIKTIAAASFPGALPLPSPNEIIQLLIKHYNDKSLGGASIIKE